MDSRSIGVFDSGIGGTSIWREIQALLPNENIIYLADSANAPYGEKSKEEILALSIKNTELLIQKNCKLIVVACNTATTNAIGYLRENYNIPFIGIEPAIKPAALQSKSKSVGVLATNGTLSSSLFHSTTENHAIGIRVIERVGKGLVPLIEKGEISGDSIRELLLNFLTPMLEEGIDHLVLGCTHYPYLIPVLKEILPPGVQIIDSGEAVARQTKAILEGNGVLNEANILGKHQFFTNGEKQVLINLAQNDAIPISVSYLNF